MTTAGGFRFKTRRPRGKLAEPPKREKLVQLEEQLPDSLQGKAVKSKEEARVGVVLPMLGWQYRYSIWLGDPALRGSIEVDFLITNYAPLPLPLLPQGTYFHLGQRKEDTELWIHELRQRTSRFWMPPVQVYDYELTSVAHTLQTLRTRIGRA